MRLSVPTEKHTTVDAAIDAFNMKLSQTDKGLFLKLPACLFDRSGQMVELMNK